MLEECVGFEAVLARSAAGGHQREQPEMRDEARSVHRLHPHEPRRRAEPDRRRVTRTAAAAHRLEREPDGGVRQHLNATERSEDVVLVEASERRACAERGHWRQVHGVERRSGRERLGIERVKEARVGTGRGVQRAATHRRQIARPHTPGPSSKRVEEYRTETASGQRVERPCEVWGPRIRGHVLGDVGGPRGARHPSTVLAGRRAAQATCRSLGVPLGAPGQPTLRTPVRERMTYEQQSFGGEGNGEHAGHAGFDSPT